MKIIVKPIMLFTFSIIATAILASFAQAQSKQESWVTLGTSEGEIAEFEINNFVLTSEGTVIIWRRSTPRLDTEIGRNALGNLQSAAKMEIPENKARTIRKFLSREEFNCLSNENRILESKYLDEKGNVVITVPESKSPKNWKKAREGSVNMADSDFACRLVPKVFRVEVANTQIEIPKDFVVRMNADTSGALLIPKNLGFGLNIRLFQLPTYQETIQENKRLITESVGRITFDQSEGRLFDGMKSIRLSAKGTQQTVETYIIQISPSIYLVTTGIFAIGTETKTENISVYNKFLNGIKRLKVQK